MGFNFKKLKNNIGFFIVAILLIVILTLINYISDKKVNSLDKVDLVDGDVNISKLVINEIMTSNKGAYADQNGKIYDYVEIYNGSEKDVNLKDYGLSDEESKVKWVFPETIIGPKEYIVVFLSGNRSEGLYANFKLKASGGERMALFKPNGKVVDAVDTVALDGNTVMARDLVGKWVVQAEATPGYANTKEGRSEFLASLISDEEKVVEINEILANNKGNFKNKNGEYSGYIEVRNVSKDRVDLANYGLSNSEIASFKWQFPSVTLDPGEVIVVYTSGKSCKICEELSTGFKLDSKNGFAVLTNSKGKIVDKVEYKNLPNGIGYIKEDGKFLQNNAISPGYQNNVDGIKAFQKKYLSTPKDLIISEVMNNNYSYLEQNGGNYYDWIELYNNSGKTINLNNYCLTTNDNTMCSYKLPKVELKSGEYYIVMASGDTKLSNSKYQHASFKLGDTEAVYLTHDDEIVDSIMVANVPLGYSMGRNGSSIQYFSKPTPSSKNGSGTEAVSYVPTADIKSGVYDPDKEYKVTLTGSGKIYYTLDGSEPTTSSKVYSSPLTIKKTTVLRIMSKESGKLSSETETYSYILDNSHKVSVMSLVIDQKKLRKVNNNTSLNSKVQEHGYVEYFDKDGEGFSINVGLKLFGGSTRSYKKKSYEIKFKKKYGDAKLKYKVFKNVDSSVFDSLVLRTGSQDEFQYDKRAIIKDVVATSLMGEYTDVDVQDYVPIILYINGEYWGIYFIREKVDETFVSNHYNVKATKDNTSILRIDGEVKIGTDKNYNSMISFINNNNLSNSKNYEKIKEQIDVQSFIDFWIGEIYTANYDILNTRYFSNPLIDNGKWKYIFYDLDSGFFRTNKDSFKEYTSTAGMGSWNFPTTLLRNMMKNDEFKKTFVERLSYNLNNTWAYKNVNKRIDEVVDTIGKDEFKRNANRWNNSYSNWEDSISSIKKYAKSRNSYIVKYAKSYFGLSDSEVKKYFGDVE